MQSAFPLTVITPVRNAGAYFEYTLKSIEAQTCKDFEYLVLDAVSTDDTPMLIEKYRSVISYTHSRPDKGAVDAFNTGIEMARGEFIAFLSADDWLEPDAVERIVLAAQRRPDAEVISFGLTEWVESNDGQRTFFASYQDPADGVFDMESAFYMPCISRCLRRDLYVRHGLHRPEIYGHFSDRELQVRLALHRPKKAVIPQVLYHFRKHGASATGNAQDDTIVRSMACNCEIAEQYLKGQSLDKIQKELLLKWYGFAWIRQVFFLLKTKRIKQGLKVLMQGICVHPITCFLALMQHDIPPAYRSRTTSSQAF